MRLAVTGASGHVGGALVRELKEAGHEVLALVHRDRSPLAGLDVRVESVDIRDSRALQAAFDGIEGVFHAAARVTLRSDGDDEALRVNLQGTRNVVDACLRNGVRRLVHFSTSHALAEADLKSPEQGFLYERSKITAERAVLEACDSGLDALIVSPTAVIGPYDFKPSHMGEIFKLQTRGLLIAALEGGQSWIDVRDVARIARKAFDEGARAERIVASGHWMTMTDMLRRAGALTGHRGPQFTAPVAWCRKVAPAAEWAAVKLGREPLLSLASLEAIDLEARSYPAQALVKLRPLDETLRDTVAWFSERKYERN